MQLNRTQRVLGLQAVRCFYASFVSGMQGIAADVLRERFDDVSIVKLLDGAVIFKTGTSYDRLNLFCFNNIFAVIDIMEHSENISFGKNTGGESQPIELHIKKICGGVKVRKTGRTLPKELVDIISNNSKKIKTFRLVCSMENKPVSVNEKVKQYVEKLIEKNSALSVDRSKPDTEFWFLYRREGFSLFMKRLTRNTEKKLQPGELSPQLAWLLCLIAFSGPGETVKGSILIDPFCGYGAISEAALKHFPVKKIYALDIDPRCVNISLGKKSLQSERCDIRKADFLAAPVFLPWGRVDAIITDPPWGHYKETALPRGMTLAEFYEKTLGLFSRLLKSGGCAVVLAGKDFSTAVKKTQILKLEQSINILVSGKKASVFVLRNAADSEPGKK